MNLMNIPIIRAALHSRFYPAVFQWLTTAAFVVILLTALFGPNNVGQNFGVALARTVWWPLLPLSLLLFGRLWCAICPFAWLMDRVRNAVGLGLPVPRVLRRYGPWIVAVLFVLVTFADEAWGISVNTRATGYLLLTIFALAIFFGAYFERRTFCRYVCFIAAFAANYGRAGMIQLGVEPDRCSDCATRACADGSRGRPGCPVFLSPPALEDSSTCHLCGNCVKNCPRDAITVSLRTPTSGLWDVGRPQLSDAVLAGTVMGAVLLEQFSMLRLWRPLVGSAGAWLRIEASSWSFLAYGLVLAAFIAGPLTGLGLASVISQALRGDARPGEVVRNFTAFGYAIIPLALAGHIAHGLLSLLTRSRTVPFALQAMAGRFPAVAPPAWIPNSAVLPIEIAVLGLGAAASLYAGHRIARRFSRAAFLTHALVILALFAADLYALGVVFGESM